MVPYYQLQFVIVHRVWHWQLTRHALNINNTLYWLFDCLYRLSKLVEMQMINRISKKSYSRTHTPWVHLTYWILLGPPMMTHVSFEVTVPSTLIVTNWAAETRSPVCINMFTLVNDLWADQFVTINVDGTVISNDTCVVISHPSRIQ